MLGVQDSELTEKWRNSVGTVSKRSWLGRWMIAAGLAILAVSLIAHFLAAPVVISDKVYAAAALLEEDFSGGEGEQLPTRWKQVDLREAQVRAFRVQEQNNFSACLRAETKGRHLSTFYTSVHGVADVEGDVRISFRYRTSLKWAKLIVAISTGGYRLGHGAPAIKAEPELIRDGSWHDYTVTYDPTGLARGAVMMGFLLVGQGAKVGDELFIDDIVMERVPAARLEAKLHSPGSRNVFDRTPNQKVLLDLICRQKATSFTVEAYRDQEKEPWLTETYPVETTRRVAINLSAQPTGMYRVAVKAGRPQELASWNIYKHPYRENAVLIRDGVPYVNGEPFMIIGIYHASDPVIDRINNENAKGAAEGKITRKVMFQEIKNRGFNTVHYSWGPGPKEFYEEAASSGLMVVPENRESLANVPLLRDQVSLFGWYAIDEPSPFIVEKCEKLYDAYKRTDPYHPVMTAFMSAALGYGDHRLVDIALPDLYPISGPQSSVANTAAYVRNCREILLRNDPTTCVIVVPQLFTADNYLWRGFEPTYDQVRAQVYTAITAGAKGVLYYAYYTHEKLENGMSLNPKRKHWYLPESRLWNSIGRLNAELQGLKDVILFGEECSEFSTALRPPVLSRAVSLNNQLYLFLVNPTSATLSNLRVKWPGSWGKATVVHGPELKELDSNTWQTDLAGYQVGVYCIDKGRRSE